MYVTIPYTNQITKQVIHTNAVQNPQSRGGRKNNTNPETTFWNRTFDFIKQEKMKNYQTNSSWSNLVQINML
jgi:hypothetical protein